MTGWGEYACLASIPQTLITALCTRVINSELYSITNLHSGLELHKPPEIGGAWGITKFHSGLALHKPPVIGGAWPWSRDECCIASGPSSSGWQLRIPVVSAPVGWQRLRNICGDRVLSHSSLSLPPVTIEPGRSGPANHQKSWSTQWAFFRASSFSSCAGNRDYVLRNRLTGGYLRYQKSKFAHLDGGVATVNAWSKDPPTDDPWWLEHDSLQRWHIVHRATGRRLEQSIVPLLEGGVRVECASNSVNERKTWVLVYVVAPILTTIWFFCCRHLMFTL